MRELSTQELKEVQLEILDVVADFCEKNGINYWLDFGTLIGAVRHKGFIPWDDDIDISMLRQDYDKFIELFNASNTRYQLHCYELDHTYTRQFGKVFDHNTVINPSDKEFHDCINIDVWVVDNAPDSKGKLIKKWIFQHIYVVLHAYNVFHSSFPKYKGSATRFIRHVFYWMLGNALHIVPTSIMPRSYFAKKIIQNARTYIDEKTRRVGCFVVGERNVIEREKLAHTIYAEFEGKKYRIPSGYDEWLRKFYGDYMQLPPEEERYSHHTKGFMKED